MAEPGRRVVLHIDMDAFFAAVEQHRRPDLRGKPVVVGGRGDPTERGVVSTASYEARRFGIHSAMPLRTAYKRCPDAVFLPVDMPAYVAVSKTVKAVLREFSPNVGDAGLDEAFLELSDWDRDPTEIADAIKRRLRAETGLTCSVGIAPNRLLAKIASDLDKPDGLTVITEGDVEARVWPLSVRALWGVGPKTEARLAPLGVSTVGDLAALSVELLTREFGQSFGQYLHRAAHGIDDSPVIGQWQRKSASRDKTFQQDVGDEEVLVAEVVRLTAEIAAWARDKDYRARTVTVKVRFTNFVTLTRSLTLPEATDDLATLQTAATECLARVELRRKVRLIGVRLSNLEAGSNSRTA